jgi:hypothetical protein
MTQQFSPSCRSYLGDRSQALDRLMGITGMNCDRSPEEPSANRPDRSGSGETGYTARGTRRVPRNGPRRALYFDRAGRRIPIVYGQAHEHPTARLCVDFARQPLFFYRVRPKRAPRGTTPNRAARKQPAPARPRRPLRWEPIVRWLPTPRGPLGLVRRAGARGGLLRSPGWARAKAETQRPAGARRNIPWELARRNGPRSPQW